MKLYTEEQMLQAFNYGKSLEPFDCFDDLVNSLTPIELPSDEEIEDYALSVSPNPPKNQGSWIAYKAAIEGAKWVINKIKRSAMKETAIEWLFEQMLKQGFFVGNKPLSYTTLDHLQQQAKEMERTQIEAGFYHGWESCSDDVATRKYHDSGTYYYKTYGVNNE